MADVEVQQHQQEHRPTLRKSLLILNFVMLTVGACGCTLVLRLYFLKGGRRKWLSTCLQYAGWPANLVPLAVSYRSRRKTDETDNVKTKPFLITPSIFLACATLGILMGINGLLYSYGLSCLPASTATLIGSTQLGFTAASAFLLVRQRFTPYSINAIVLLTMGAVVLGAHSDGDRPQGVSAGQYLAGFVTTLGAAGLFGLVFPLVEATYAKAEQAVTYTLVMEMQMVLGLFAAAFCTVGMLANRDFQAISREASEFELGEAKYYVLLIGSVVIWQMFFLGTFGAIFFGSALLSGIITSANVPVTALLAVIFFHESFTVDKGVALALSLWGFASYFYGEYKESSQERSSCDPDPCYLLSAS